MKLICSFQTVMKTILLTLNFVLAIIIILDLFHKYKLSDIQIQICYFLLGLLSAYNLIKIIKPNKKN
ncbi:hypothetical protein DRF60_11875 [Chryseobacterium elymi]|uniref:Uncharacterized protein n=1 Tax=Chryseobacterium elymi TaxID=395936 RepID=A0A3D9DGG9_9FLAO|nr:hypothetical protein DRF60_11875 [Chryseobacterium elymi]